MLLKFIRRLKYLFSLSYLKSVHYTLSGTRFEQLRSDLAKIDGRLERHGARLSQLEAVAGKLQAELRQMRAGTGESFALHHSIVRHSEFAGDAAPRLAVISAMPPAETGIASCTFRTFIAAGYGVDVYTKYGSTMEYMHAINDARLIGKDIRIFDVASLSHQMLSNNYIATVFVLGNSAHNLQTAEALRLTRHFRTPVPVLVYIHDPCLLNLLNLVCERENSSLLPVLKAAYTDYLKGRPSNMSVLDMLAIGIVGLRPLLSGVPIAGIIVNSNAAKEIVLKDSPNFDADRVHVLFHPIFPKPRAARKVSPTPTIATFGIPSSAKRTEVITEAWSKLHASGKNMRFLMAGFDLLEYVGPRPLGYEIELVDSPSESDLEDLMARTDVALQLRTQNLGESSGVVAQLIGVGVPTIVSDLGAFSELGDVVRRVPPAASADDLANVIEEVLRHSADYIPRMRAYAKRHGPHRFCEELWIIAERYHASVANKPGKKRAYTIKGPSAEGNIQSEERGLTAPE